MSVAFEPLSAFSIGDYGLFWAELMAEFPTTEAMEPVPVEIEQFDGFKPAQVGFQLVSAGMLPRAAFRNAELGELVQIQNDRFGFNWIKTSDDHQYPHSEATLARFFELLERFKAFVDRRGFGDLNFVQCELTNVNIVPISDVGESFADFATVLKLAPVKVDCDNLRLENQLVGSKHLMTDESGAVIGRVHTIGQPAVRVPNNEVAFRLDIAARGAPLGAGLEGARRFFDEAVSAVNAVFLASVTRSGRRFWGEI